MSRSAGTRTRSRTRGARVSRRALERLLERWVAGLASRSEHTARSYRRAAQDFLTHVDDGDLGSAVASYLGSLGGLSAASRAHHVSAVRSFLRFAKEQGALVRSAEDLLVRPRVAVTSYGRYLNIEEVRDLLAAAAGLSARHLAAVAALALTGLRVSELTGARWRDLFRDPERRLGLRVVGKGGKERVVKVREDLFRLLAELHGSDELDARDDSPLLPDSRGTAYTTRGVHKLVAQAAEASGVPKPVSPHWLRHTHATLAAAGGASAFTIQASLGHARLETSQRYVHWARGLKETTVDSLPPLGLEKGGEGTRVGPGRG